MAAFAETVALAEGKPSLPIQTAAFSWADDLEASLEEETAVQAVHVNPTVKGRGQDKNKNCARSLVKLVFSVSITFTLLISQMRIKCTFNAIIFV